MAHARGSRWIPLPLVLATGGVLAAWGVLREVRSPASADDRSGLETPAHVEGVLTVSAYGAAGADPSTREPRTQPLPSDAVVRRAEALEALAAEVEAAGDLTSDELRESYQHRSMKLERAALLRETPESCRGVTQERLSTFLREIRSAFWSRPMPDTIPFVPSPPAEWQTRSADGSN